MNTIFAFLVEVAATFGICALTFRYLRPFLKRVLVDLCGTEERAQFWTVFSGILLVGLPLLFALGYHPEAGTAEELFFDVAGKLGGNLGSLLFALVGVGMIVSFFALVAPKPAKAESK